MALQADTFVRAASNVATFGLADNAEAAWEAATEDYPGSFGERYQRALREQVERNVYDHVNRGMAQKLGYIAGVAGMVGDAAILGAEASAALPRAAKGALGEGLSMGKTILKGDWPIGTQVRKTMQNEKVTVLDHETKKGIYVESKFGPHARLSRNQKYAQRQWGDGYRVDRWMPRHVGAIAGAGASGPGLFSASLEERRSQGK